VHFINFDDVKAGRLGEFDVVINAGDAGTAWSGGEYWTDEEIVTAVRKFVHNGGGFIGVGEPTACLKNGKFFQLSDVLGVEREMGQSLIFERYNFDQVSDFAYDGSVEFDYGEHLSNVYAKEGTQVLSSSNGQVYMATKRYGKGKSYYITGMKYTPENSRTLYKMLLSSCNKEDKLTSWYCDNVNVECNNYSNGAYAIVNNSYVEQTTNFYDGEGNVSVVTLAPMEIIIGG
jgi:1,3-beta-galactosyl-N-acetylhexosamine phosphorylase